MLCLKNWLLLLFPRLPVILKVVGKRFPHPIFGKKVFVPNIDLLKNRKSFGLLISKSRILSSDSVPLPNGKFFHDIFLSEDFRLQVESRFGVLRDMIVSYDGDVVCFVCFSLPGGTGAQNVSSDFRMGLCLDEGFFAATIVNNQAYRPLVFDTSVLEKYKRRFDKRREFLCQKLDSASGDDRLAVRQEFERLELRHDRFLFNLVNRIVNRVLRDFDRFGVSDVAVVAKDSWVGGDVFCFNGEHVFDRFIKVFIGKAGNVGRGVIVVRDDLVRDVSFFDGDPVQDFGFLLVDSPKKPSGSRSGVWFERSNGERLLACLNAAGNGVRRVFGDGSVCVSDECGSWPGWKELICNPVVIKL